MHLLGGRQPDTGLPAGSNTWKPLKTERQNGRTVLEHSVIDQIAQ